MRSLMIQKVFLHLLDGTSMKGSVTFPEYLHVNVNVCSNSMRISRESVNIDTASGGTNPEPNIEVTEYTIFSTDPTTYQEWLQKIAEWGWDMQFQ
ncbi:uncharacterized protein N7496_007813 [Penicillium cataractarum]|uniref:Uncharacterized protein n=1 Tax=Penicillium cataractarum TaxID=2100454 RepID=A0A9W9S1Y6_9EURO|nr:uncharacterized protein N7496_007813 [Penicillium cataractarum]KAJ5368053.1 hypothetical protein N7496_007813 [Penicillium cataractarum]